MSLLLRKAGLTLSVAETAFGSSIIQTLKSMEGSPDFFRLGVTVVSPEMAQQLLSLPSSLQQDLLHPDMARGLAEGVRRLAGSDLGLGIAGRAAVEKGQDHVVHIALSHSGGTECIEQRWPQAMRFIENRMTKTAVVRS